MHISLEVRTQNENCRATLIRFTLSVLFLVFLNKLVAQAPDWEWVHSANSGGFEIAYDVVADPSSNEVYVVGEWANDLSAVFPSGTNPSSDFSLTYGNEDGFVAKYDQEGNFIWAFKLGGDDHDHISAIALDPSGNIYITGACGKGTNYFSGTSIVSLASTQENSDKNDFFIAKYNPSGEFQWVQFSESNSNDFQGLDVTANSSSVFATGVSNGTGTFGSLSISTTFNSEDFFLIKYDEDGAEQWIIIGGGNDSDFAYGVAADETQVYLAGSFKDSQIQLTDTSETTVATLSNVDMEDIFFASYDMAGNHIWSQSIASDEKDECHGITLDNQNLYLTGTVNNEVNFPSFAGNPVSASDNEDVFISSHSKLNGNTVWAYTIPCSGGSDDFGLSIAWNRLDDLYFTGYFKDEMNFPDATVLTAVGSEDVFVAAYTSGGTFKWAKSAGSVGHDYGYGIAVGSGGSIYTAGDYEKLANFDLLTLPDNGSHNVYLAKLQEPCTDAVGGIVSSTVPAICEGDSAILTLSGYSGSIVWQSSPTGMGAWSEIPGETLEDVIVSPLINSDFRAYLTNGSCNPDSSNILSVNVTLPPAVDAGADAEICISDGTFTISGSSSDNGTILWSSSGDGSFDVPATDNPTYTIGSETGSVFLIKTVSSPGSCADAVDSMTLTLTPVPLVDAGADAEVCWSTGIFNLSGSSSDNGIILWTSSGDGTFDDAATDNPAYTIGSETSSVTLTKTVIGLGSCSNVGDSMVLTLIPPYSNAGPDAEVCVDEGLFNIVGSSSANGTILWTSSGDGSFDNDTIDNPIYTLGSETDSVILLKTVISTGACSDAVNSMVLTLTPEPLVDAGPDAEICATEVSFSLLGTTSSNGTILWTSSGDGSFDDASSDNPTYTPGTETGSVLLMKTVSGDGSCSNAVDSMILRLIPVPVANAGSGGDQCNLEFQLSAIPSIGLGLWTQTSGPGESTFNPSANSPDALVSVTQYGSYEFTWTETEEVCSGSDLVVVTFHEQDIADAGTDQFLEFVFSTQLEANSPEEGTGTWTVLEGSGLIEDENDPGSMIYDLSLGEVELMWSISSIACDEVSDIMMITVGDLQAPTVITPNNDGFNDFLIFPGVESQEGTEIIIYNRWGTEVYRNADYQNDWDGKDYKGRDLISDTYFYVLKLPSSRIVKSFVEIRR